MKIILFKIGKVSNKHAQGLFDYYLKRIQPFCKIEVSEIKTVDSGSKSLIQMEKIRSRVNHLVLLDERGEQMTSETQASWLLKKTEDPGVQTLGFVVGGPFGFTNEERLLADYLWSFSKGVLPNEIAWVILAEQVYRSFSIINGSPYHHQ